MSITCRLIVGLVWVLSSMRASAHETWLSPSTYQAAPLATIVLRLTSGTAFPKLEYAIKPGRIAQASYRLGGKWVRLEVGKSSMDALTFSASPSQAGVATFFIELKAHPISLSDQKVAEYLAEIDADAGVRQAWQTRKKPAHWTETYTKFAKTLVRVGSGSADASWRQPIGRGLEIVPMSDPFSWHGGGVSSVRLLSRGVPVAAARVGIMQANSNGRRFATTDADGVARFDLTSAGSALFFAVTLRQTSKSMSWASQFTTLAVPVQ